jgi:hypothetical protein
VPRRGALGKEFFLKKIFAECHVEGHSAKNFQKKNLCRVPRRGVLGKEFSKKISLPSATQSGTRQRIFKKKILVECHSEGTRQRI